MNFEVIICNNFALDSTSQLYSRPTKMYFYLYEILVCCKYKEIKYKRLGKFLKKMHVKVYCEKLNKELQKDGGRDGCVFTILTIL